MNTPFNQVKRKLKEILKTILPNKDIHSLIPISDSFYFSHPNYWEPNVVIACRDILNIGDIFWDIGANVGGVTRLGSRIVGPTGLVIAVEASLNNFKKLNQNVIVNHLNNVYLINAAIYSKDFLPLTLYNGSGESDSIFQNDRLNKSSEKVESLSLDTLEAMFGTPSLIKIDIEGAEYEAMVGSKNLLSKAQNRKRPLIILEQSKDNLSACKLLMSNDYQIQNLSNAQELDENFEIDLEPVLNLLAIPKERILEFSKFLIPFEFRTNDFDFYNDSFSIKDLQVGRYLLDIQIKPTEGENVFVSVYNGHELISRYHGDAQWLQSSYKMRQIDFRHTGDLIIRIEDPEGTKTPLSALLSIRLWERPNFPINRRSYSLSL